MIKNIVSFTIIIVLFSYPLGIQVGLLPNSAKWIVELISISVLIFCLLSYSINKKFQASYNYIVLFIIHIIAIVLSSVINKNGAVEFLIGIRYFYKSIPFFLLPIVHRIEPLFFKKQINLILLILLFQLPITVFQRFILFSHLVTGDVVTGSIGESSALSISLIIAISLIYSFYLKNIINTFTFISISILLFFPTTINETKGTLFLLPLSLFIPTLVVHGVTIAKRVKSIIFGIIAITILISTFAIVYQNLYSRDGSGGLDDYLRREMRGQGYLYHSDDNVNKGREVGRFDSLLLAIDYLSKKPINFAVGMGIGGTIESKISMLKSKPSEISEYAPHLIAIVTIFWEHGLIGVLLSFIFLFFLLQDALKQRKEISFIGDLSSGWVATVPIICVVLFYKNIFDFDSIIITFMYISGVIVSNNTFKIE